MSIAPIQPSTSKTEAPPSQSPVVIGRFELVKDDEIPDWVKKETEMSEKLKIAKTRALELLMSCTVPFQPLGSNPVAEESASAPTGQFVASKQKMVSKQMRVLSQKYHTLYCKFSLLVKDLGKDVSAHQDAEEPPLIWFKRRNNLAQLLFSCKKGLEQGVQQDIDQLHQHLLTCVSAQESVRKQKASGKQEIEFPDVFGGEPIKVQTDNEFVLMETYYNDYSELLERCIKYTRKFATPIYRAIGIIECFPDKIHLLDPVNSEGKEQKECPAKS